MIKFMVLMYLLNPDGSVSVPSVPRDALFDTHSACDARRVHQALTYRVPAGTHVAWLCVPVWAYEV